MAGSPNPPAGTAFVVRRRVRDEYGRDDIPAPHDQYTAAFADRSLAEAHALALHWEYVRLDGGVTAARVTVLGFGWGLEHLTSLPEHVFRDWLLDGGIDPPDPIPPTDPTPHRAPWMTDADWRDEQRRWAMGWAELTTAGKAARRESHTAALTAAAWREWWVVVVAGGLLAAEQVEHLWEGLNLVRFYEAVEVPHHAQPPNQRTGFAVVHAHWEYDDCWYQGANDALVMFPSRAAAEAEARRRQVELGADGEFANGGPNAVVVVELSWPAEE